MPITHTSTAPPPREIEGDRRCAGCGYNLRGLMDRGRCPECGNPVRLDRRIDDPLSLMPMSVIKAFRRGCLLASVSLFVVVGLHVTAAVIKTPGAPYHFLLAGAFSLWAVAAWWLTPAFDLPQAVRHGFGSRSGLRTAARWLQLSLPLGSLLAGVGLSLPGGSVWAAILVQGGTWLAIIVGMAGIVTLSVLLQRLADWARDEDAERALNWVAFGLPFSTFLLAALPTILVLHVFLLLIWVVSVFAFPYGLLMLSKSVTLSVLHAQEHQERERRRFERQQREAEAMTARALRTGSGASASEGSRA